MNSLQRAPAPLKLVRSQLMGCLRSTGSAISDQGNDQHIPSTMSQWGDDLQSAPFIDNRFVEGYSRFCGL
jgi:hypothetical protein